MSPALDSVKPGDIVAITGGHMGTVAVAVTRATATQIITAGSSGREQRWSRGTGFAVPRARDGRRRLCVMTPKLAEEAEANAALRRCERASFSLDTKCRSFGVSRLPTERLKQAADAMEMALKLLSEDGL